jgi:branched-chain amino acid transport system substrate-binding protein
LVVLATAWTLTPGCSLIVDSNAAQCDVTPDCTKKGAGFAGTACIDHVCVAPSAVTCTTNATCASNVGGGYVCRSGRCASIASAECTGVSRPPPYPDDALFIGGIFPLSGDAASEGIPLSHGMRIAADEFIAAAGGLPPRPGGTARPIVIVECDDMGKADVAERAATHLVKDLGVPAIVGGAFSGIAISVATHVTIPGGTLLISPSATSIDLTQLPGKNNLVWRTSPSDEIQAKALAELLKQIEAELRTDPKLMGDIRLAVVHKGDSYGKGLAVAFTQAAFFNGKKALSATSATLIDVNYGNPDDPVASPPDYDGVSAKIAALRPHVVLIVGTAEAAKEILPRVEKAAAAMPAPRYLLADGSRIGELVAAVGADTTGTLRSRIVGTSPGTNNDNFKAFELLYTSIIKDSSSPGVFGAAGAYDATYLLAYSAASLGAMPITGASLAQGMGALVPQGAPIAVGESQINPAFSTLTTGHIDFDGASGPLDFNLTTGEAPSDIQVWCVPLVGGKPGDPINTPAYYLAKDGALTPNALATAKAECKL